MAEKSQGKDRESAKKGGMIVLIAGVCVVIILLVAVIVILLARSPGGQQPVQDEGRDTVETGMRGTVVMDEGALEGILGSLEESDFVEPGNYEVRMSNSWTFPDGTSPSPDSFVENAAGNTNDVYFDLVLLNEDMSAEDEEVIYASPVIPRGAFVENIVLDKDLDAGDYACAVVYHLIDDQQRTLSTLRVAVSVHVAS